MEGLVASIQCAGGTGQTGTNFGAMSHLLGMQAPREDMRSTLHWRTEESLVMHEHLNPILFPSAHGKTDALRAVACDDAVSSNCYTLIYCIPLLWPFMVENLDPSDTNRKRDHFCQH